MKKTVVSIVLASLVLCVCGLVPAVLAEEESTIDTNDGWPAILEELDTYDWISEEEKEEYHKYYFHNVERGYSDEQIRELIIQNVKFHHDIQKSYVFRTAVFGPDLSQLSLHERLERWSPALTVVEETAQQWYYADLLDLAKLGELV
ncbi:MAG: hypothetical protein ILP14_14290, partial [Oscillospiraceae bacterium]|nr:hypothetical protein [Oscillospiraceae bacterium]